MNFCKDCKFSTYTGHGTDLYWCHHKKLGVNVVDGSNEKDLCFAVRRDKDRCGYEGVWFEKKKE